jgi:hypothetical protein
VAGGAAGGVEGGAPVSGVLAPSGGQDYSVGSASVTPEPALSSPSPHFVRPWSTVLSRRVPEYPLLAIHAQHRVGALHSDDLERVLALWGYGGVVSLSASSVVALFEIATQRL